MIGGIASLLVATTALLVPNVKKKLGFKKGITLTQSFAVLALVALATTEFFTNYLWALPIAVLCFWVRTPLMNMAAPMTSELTMNYVGEKNQEMLSAVMAAIWRKLVFQFADFPFFNRSRFALCIYLLFNRSALCYWSFYVLLANFRI